VLDVQVPACRVSRSSHTQIGSVTGQISPKQPPTVSSVAPCWRGLGVAPVYHCGRQRVFGFRLKELHLFGDEHTQCPSDEATRKTINCAP
jgi:hypothetical protein